MTVEPVSFYFYIKLRS